jgi:two-component system, sensor histidine kinase
MHAKGLEMQGNDDKIVVAVAQQLLRGWPSSGNSVIVSGMLAYAHRNVVPAGFLVGWVGAFAILSFVLTAMWFGKRHRSPDPELARRVTLENVVAVGGFGLVWGVGSAMLLLHGGASEQLLVLVALFALSIVILFSNSYHFPSFLVFFILSVAPSVPALLIQHHPGNDGLTALLVTFIITMCFFGLNLNKMVRQSLTLRFENVALVEELTLQKEIAEEANISKSRFLAAASHDLRQPVHAFSLYLGALGALDLPVQARLLSSKLYQCMHSMEGLFRALLDVSQLDAGAVHPEFQVFDVATLLGRLRVEFEPQAQAKGLVLRVGRCAAWVAGDQALTERILRNLLSNAIRYTERGKILLGCRRRGPSLRMGVYDTGIGIPVEDQRKIFEEFLQLGNPQRDRSRGLGLGLSIVERLARLLDLPVGVRSEPGHGSVFTIDLPLAEESTHLVSPMPRPLVAVDELTGRTIVVVDDEQAILDATRSLMEAWGCNVVTAGSGAEAIGCLTEFDQPPDLVLCDYRLAGNMNGLEVVERLREEFNMEFPAILVTGDTAPERLRQLEASGLPVLHKPMEAQALRQALLLALR